MRKRFVPDANYYRNQNLAVARMIVKNAAAYNAKAAKDGGGDPREDCGLVLWAREIMAQHHASQPGPDFRQMAIGQDA